MQGGTKITGKRNTAMCFHATALYNIAQVISYCQQTHHISGFTNCHEVTIIHASNKDRAREL